MKINEIFYSIQGEGRFTGTPAVFIRFSGCNLACSFCDTEHRSHDEIDPETILDRIAGYPSRHLVITGGEPALQLTASFVDQLHEHGYFVQVETNGTVPLPDRVDWITCSPKEQPIVYRQVDELKVVYQGAHQDMSPYAHIEATERYLQPCDTKHPETNRKIIDETIRYIKQHPQWKLSLQTQKILNVQ